MKGFLGSQEGLGSIRIFSSGFLDYCLFETSSAGSTKVTNEQLEEFRASLLNMQSGGLATLARTSLSRPIQFSKQPSLFISRWLYICGKVGEISSDCTSFVKNPRNYEQHFWRH